MGKFWWIISEEPGNIRLVWAIALAVLVVMLLEFWVWGVH